MKLKDQVQKNILRHDQGFEMSQKIEVHPAVLHARLQAGAAHGL